MNDELSLPQINARMFVLERELARTCEQKTQIEERCTQILGRFLLAQIRKRYGQRITLADTQYLSLDGTSLDKWLAEDNDRQAFGLPLRGSHPPSTTASPVPSRSRPDYSAEPCIPFTLTLSIRGRTCRVLSGLQSHSDLSLRPRVSGAAVA